MNSIIKAMQQEEINAIPEIRRLLEEVKKLSSIEFTKETAERLTHEKHSYSVHGYINQLRKVITLLEAGAEPEETLEIVDSCVDIDSYIAVMNGKENENV